MEDDYDAASPGLMQVLKQYKPGLAADEKPSAKAKVQPSRATTQGQQIRVHKRKDAPSSSSKPKDSLKTTIGNASKRSRPVKVESEPHVFSGVPMADDLSPADKEIVDGFQSRFKALKIVSPPLSEPAFKSKLGDLLSSCNTFMAEIKTKKRSAQRRNNADDLLVGALDTLETQMKDHIHILKCHLDSS